MSGGKPSARSAAAAKIAPSRQCAVRSARTRRGDQAVVARWYGSASRNRWMPYGVLRARRVRRSAGVKCATTQFSGRPTALRIPPYRRTRPKRWSQSGNSPASTALQLEAASSSEREEARARVRYLRNKERTMRHVALFIVVLALTLAGLPGARPALVAATTGNGAPNGAHYNLNII